jgi:hypothetical protein
LSENFLKPDRAYFLRLSDSFDFSMDSGAWVMRVFAQLLHRSRALNQIHRLKTNPPGVAAYKSPTDEIINLSSLHISHKLREIPSVSISVMLFIENPTGCADHINCSMAHQSVWSTNKYRRCIATVGRPTFEEKFHLKGRTVSDNLGSVSAGRHFFRRLLRSSN